ncbi:MAG: HAD-IIA family hydrolase [Planctomycetota bacterium]
MHSLLAGKALLIDMDGVVYRGGEAIPGAAEFIAGLQRDRVPFLFVTNNSDHPIDSFIAKLARMHIQVGAEHLFTAGQATARALVEQIGPTGCAYTIAGPGTHDALRAAGWSTREDEGAPYGHGRIDPVGVQAVVIGEGYKLTALRLEQAILLCMAGVPLYATNPDTFIPGPGGVRLIGTGCLYAGIEVATGKKARVVGKPAAPMYRYALEKLGRDSAQPAVHAAAAMIGDRLDTDISGAKAIGMTGVLVLSGATTAAMVPGFEPAPDLVVGSLADLG